MKKVIGFLFWITLLSIVYFYKTDITTYIVHNFIYKKEIVVPEPNSYQRKYDFEFVQTTDNFYPSNKQELYNVFYTILNNGYENFTFYCGKKYSNCMNDVRKITDSENSTLSTINNYVHPFNSYSTISINMNNLGRVNVEVDKLYTEADIYTINKEVSRIYSLIIKSNMTDAQKVKAVHDYIVNNTSYDKTWVNSTNKTSRANTAFGPLFNKVALCGGYTDLMELFLERMNIKSYKIASDNHIWNYVFIDNNWKHLDLTWDDPVTNTGKNLLQYDYYLINTTALESKNDKEHVYDKTLYIEAK